MQTNAHDNASHDHETSVRRYVTVWLVLVGLTVVTVAVTWLDMKKFAVFTAMLIATVKASLVLLDFMHLRHGPRKYALMVGLALVLLAIFLFLTFIDVVNLQP